MTTDDQLRAMAEAAGHRHHWRDVHGEENIGRRRTRCARCSPPSACRRTRPRRARVLRGRWPTALPPLITMTAGPDGAAIPGAEPGHRFRLDIEGGDRIEGHLEQGWGGEARLPAVSTPGYHRLHLDDAHCIVAAAPPRCVGLADLGAAAHGGAAALGAGGADLFAAPPRRLGHRRFRRRRRAGRRPPAGAARRARGQPGACAVLGRSRQVRALRALLPHLPQRPARRSGRRAGQPHAATTAGAAGCADRLAGRDAAQAGPAAHAVRRPPPTTRASSTTATRPAPRSNAMRGSRRCTRTCWRATRRSGSWRDWPAEYRDARQPGRAALRPRQRRPRSPSTPSANGWPMRRAARRSRRRARPACRSA